MLLIKLMVYIASSAAAILIADYIAFLSPKLNELRLRGGAWEILNKKPLSCSPCLSFWLSLAFNIGLYDMHYTPLLIILIPLIIFFVNKKIKQHGNKFE